MAEAVLADTADDKPLSPSAEASLLEGPTASVSSDITVQASGAVQTEQLAIQNGEQSVSHASYVAHIPASVGALSAVGPTPAQPSSLAQYSLPLMPVSESTPKPDLGEQGSALVAIGSQSLSPASCGQVVHYPASCGQVVQSSPMLCEAASILARCHSAVSSVILMDGFQRPMTLLDWPQRTLSHTFALLNKASA